MKHSAPSTQKLHQLFVWPYSLIADGPSISEYTNILPGTPKLWELKKNNINTSNKKKFYIDS